MRHPRIRQAGGRWLQGLALYGVVFALCALILGAAPGFLGNDDYYHARLSAEILRQGRLALDFPWLPYTILSPAGFTDHHLLYHLFLAPWVTLGGVTGAKLAAAAIGAGVFLAAWGLLRQIGVRHAALWTLAMLGLSSPFLYRLLMIRTQGAALLLLILALTALFAQRPRWLLILAFAFTWLYDGFILILAVAGLYALAVGIVERRLAWRSVAWTAAGIGLGLVINPYFPQNVSFILAHLGDKVDFGGGVRVGQEWYPYTTGALLETSGGALLAFAAGLLRPSFGGRPARRRDVVETTLLLVALLTLFMLFRSRRFIEYYPAFGLLFAAAAWGRHPIDVARWFPTVWGRGARWVRGAAAGGVLLGGLLLAAMTVQATVQDARKTADPGRFAGAAVWLAAYTPPGAPVFQTDWDDFTRLFYYNTHNTYLVGLDPTYLERADPQLWTDWVAITQGDVSTPGTAIRSEFGAAYVVSDTQHAAFAAQAEADPGLRLVYRDSDSLVWEVVGALPNVVANDRPGSAGYSN
jgi:hypothetical protein